MGFSGDRTYDASVEAVIALFVDPDVVRSRYERRWRPRHRDP